MQILKGKTSRPRKVLLYGTHGVGKTTWASGQGTLILDVEGGCGDLGCDRTPVLKTLPDFTTALMEIDGVSGYQWIAIDTVDWLESLIHADVAAKAGKETIADIPFGQGYVSAVKYWSYILTSLNNLATKNNLGVILLSHAKVAQVKPPDGDTYDRYEPDTHKSSSSLLQEWCDEVFFATYKVDIIPKEEGFNKVRNRALGGTKRVIYTSEAATHLAKHRIEMPATLPMEFRAYLGCIQAAYATTQTIGNIAGLVVTEGSSKQKE